MRVWVNVGGLVGLLAGLGACGSSSARLGRDGGAAGASPDATAELALPDAAADSRPDADDGGRDLAAPPKDVPGWVGVRRLSDAEYANTIQDLLGVPAGNWRAYAGLPVTPEAPNEGIASFDNRADTHTISAAGYEQYFAAAITLTDAAFADATLRGRLVTCAPAAAADDTCARMLLHAIGLRAWRRPLSEPDVDGLLIVVHAAATAGADFASSIKRAVAALLVSESFLYRIEIDAMPDGGGVRPLTSYELASRLSYLLWSTMPDDALFALASQDQLTDPKVLTAQVTRMLADARSDGLVRNFLGQWLGFRALDGALLDRGPAWTAALQASAAEEARRFVTEAVAGDRSLGALLTTDVNFVDDRLATLYGFPAPGSPAALVRIVNTTDSRKGVLGLAGSLAAISEPTSSAPTMRGLWVLEHLLCTEIPPPPGSFVVPTGTPREQYAALSADPSCAECHDKMDPVGLALETFDQLGRFRVKYAPADALAIDTSGRLPDGRTISDLGGLEDLLDQDAAFFSCASRNALTYALGRALISADDGALVSIDAAWAAGGHTLRALLVALVVDDAFRLRDAKGQP